MMKFVTTCLATAMIANVALAGDEIPVVPASVMKNAVQTAQKVKVDRETVPEKSIKGARVSQDSVLTMEPGVNQLIPIAINHPNRIVTPFGSPEVTSTSLSAGKDGACGEVCIKQNVIYVATDKAGAPVTMFINEKGNQNRALSLTMIPKRIPPREVFLKMEGQSYVGGAASQSFNTTAKKWERSQPYVETIRDAFRKLALGNVPAGYTLTQTPNNIAPPLCKQPGVNVSFKNGQMLAGHSLTIFVGVAENTGSRPLEFKEASCGDWDVAGVSAWPHSVLNPGQKTEVYVARKVVQGKAKTSKRPALIGGN